MQTMRIIKNAVFLIIVTFLLFSLIELSVRFFYKNELTYNLSEWIKSNSKAFDGDENFNEIIKQFNGECKYPALITEKSITYYAKSFSCGGITYVDKKRRSIKKQIYDWVCK